MHWGKKNRQTTGLEIEGKGLLQSYYVSKNLDGLYIFLCLERLVTDLCYIICEERVDAKDPFKDNMTFKNNLFNTRIANSFE